MIDRLMEALQAAGDMGSVALLNRSYSCFPISPSNFSPVNPLPTNLVFLDGGNAELVSAPNISLHLVRIAAVSFRDGKRLGVEVNEGYVLSRAVQRDGSIVYDSEIFSPDFKVSFDPLDKSLAEGPHRASISKIGEVARRLLELSAAERFAAAGNSVVLDGTLEASYPEETKLLDRLYACPAPVSALAKTSSILTDRGFPFSAALAKIGPGGSWSYYPVAESKSHKAHIFFVKLHEKSGHVFRFECSRRESSIIPMLAHNSRDALFPGYPYGLILADRAARISNRECESRKFMIHSRLGSRLKDFIAAGNAHDFLDRI